MSDITQKIATIAEIVPNIEKSVIEQILRSNNCDLGKFLIDVSSVSFIILSLCLYRKGN